MKHIERLIFRTISHLRLNAIIKALMVGFGAALIGGGFALEEWVWVMGMLSFFIQYDQLGGFQRSKGKGQGNFASAFWSVGVYVLQGPIP